MLVSPGWAGTAAETLWTSRWLQPGTAGDGCATSAQKPQQSLTWFPFYLPEQFYMGRSPGIWDLHLTGVSLEDAEPHGVDIPAL